MYKYPISDRERLKFERKLANFTVKSGCHIWSGNAISQHGYGLIRVVFRGKRTQFKVHRLAYFLRIKQSLDPYYHVSHLCHNKLCLKFTHLSYEPALINNSRNSCKNDGECHGHRGYQNCILQK